MKFHINSGLGPDDLRRGVDYAVVYVRRSTGQSVGTPRPLKALYEPMLGNMIVVDPMMDPDRFEVDPVPRELQVLGLWESRAYPLLNTTFRLDEMHEQYALAEKTWAGYAAHQLGQVLRHNELAKRLTKFGVQRSVERYIEHQNTANGVERSLVLNYDELDQLLTAANA